LANAEEMRVVANFLDSLRKVRLKLSTEKLATSNQTPNSSTTHKLNKGVKESSIGIDHTEVPQNTPAGSDQMWHNIKRVLLMCGGQKQPEGFKKLTSASSCAPLNHRYRDWNARVVWQRHQPKLKSRRAKESQVS